MKRMGYAEGFNYRYAIVARIHASALQLKVTIRPMAENPGQSDVYFSFGMMCFPITPEKIQAEPGIQEQFCNPHPDLKIGDQGQTLIWSMLDGEYVAVEGADCVLWNHISIERMVVPEGEARAIAVEAAQQMTDLVKKSIGSSETIDVIFEFTKWCEFEGGLHSAKYALVQGTLRALTVDCRSIVFQTGRKHGAHESYYYHHQRLPHVSILDINALRQFGAVRYYCFTGVDDTTSFAVQREWLEDLEQKDFWRSLSLHQFLSWTYASNLDERQRGLSSRRHRLASILHACKIIDNELPPAPGAHSPRSPTLPPRKRKLSPLSPRP